MNQIISNSNKNKKKLLKYKVKMKPLFIQKIVVHLSTKLSCYKKLNNVVCKNKLKQLILFKFYIRYGEKFVFEVQINN